MALQPWRTGKVIRIENETQAHAVSGLKYLVTLLLILLQDNLLHWISLFMKK
jgi:hypothetical protein